MKSTEDMTSILNILSYISLLPEDEQDNELDKVKSHLNNMLKKGNKLNGNYKRRINKMEYQARLKRLA